MRFMKINIIAVCFSGMLLGCATIGGSRRHIAFDSQPRGLNLIVNGEAAGKTPVTFAAERSSVLELKLGSGDFSAVRSVDCKFRYGTVLLGNLGLAAFVLASPPFAGLLLAGAIGTDYFTGNAFECPFTVSESINPPEAVATEIHEKCAPVLVIPPYAGKSDLSLSYALMEEAKEFARRFDSECAIFVGPADMVAAMRRSSMEGKLFSELIGNHRERQLVQILRDTQATRGVDVVLADPAGGQVEVEFRLWDLYTKKQISSFKKKFSRESFENLQSNLLMQTLGRSLRLLPNSFALSASTPSPKYKTSIPYRETQIKNRGFVGLLSLTSVLHPDQYETWDVDFEFGPSLYFDSIHNRVAIDGDTSEGRAFISEYPEAAEQRDFRAFALSIPLDGVLSFVTPAGAVRGFFGLGTGFYKATSRDAETRKLKNFPLIHVGADWVNYVSQNVFLQLGVHGFGSLNKAALDRSRYFDFTSWNSVSFGVGYYFPATQGYIESLLAKKD
ncbi:MAG: hypothetical protein RLZZ488_2216 [Pseudomonadota bacterium]